MFLGLRYTTPLSITSEERVFKSETLNLKVQTNASQASRWRIQVGLEPTRTGSNVGALQAHKAVNGVHSSFPMKMPQHYEVQSTSTEVLVTDSVGANHEAGVDTVKVVTNGTISINAGSFISFGSFPKVYVVTEGTTTSGDIKIFPPLVDTVENLTSVNLSPDILVRYSNEDNTTMNVVDGIIVKTSLDVTEAL